MKKKIITLAVLSGLALPASSQVQMDLQALEKKAIVAAANTCQNDITNSALTETMSLMGYCGQYFNLEGNSCTKFFNDIGAFFMATTFHKSFDGGRRLLEQYGKEMAARMTFTTAFTTHEEWRKTCLLYTSPSPRDRQKSRMPSSA